MEDARTRRRRRRILGFAAATALTLVASGALFTPVLDLDRIEVRGVGGPPASEVESASGLSPGQAMVSVDAADVRRRIEEMPWVVHASVGLAWPNRVVVDVLPQAPVAALAAGAGDVEAVLTSTAQVLGLSEAVPAALAEDMGPDMVRAELPTIRIEGALPEAGDPALAQLVVLVRTLGPATRGALGEVRFSPDGKVRFELAGASEGAEVDLGDLGALPRKVQALEAVLGGAVDLECLQRLDVSVPERITIERSPGCSADPRPGEIDAPAEGDVEGSASDR